MHATTKIMHNNLIATHLLNLQSRKFHSPVPPLPWNRNQQLQTCSLNFIIIFHFNVSISWKLEHACMHKQLHLSYILPRPFSSISSALLRNSLALLRYCRIKAYPPESPTRESLLGCLVGCRFIPRDEMDGFEHIKVSELA